METSSMETSPSKRRLRVLVPLFTLVLAGLVAECGFRLFSPNFYRNETSFVEDIRIRPPNLDYVINRSFIDTEIPEVALRTNERSYYLPAARFDDPDVTIAFLGGSTTECGAVQEELRFPARVSTLLESDGIRANVLNVAYSGNTVHDSINVLLNHVVLDHPDIAIMMHASNDIGVLRTSRDYQPRMARPLDASDVLRWLKQKLSSHSWFVARMRYSIASVQGMGAQPVLVREQNVLPSSHFPEEQFRDRLRAYVALARAFRIEPVLMTQPYAQFRTDITPEWIDGTAQDEANRVIREVGLEQDVLVIDLIRHLKEHVADFNEPMIVFYDAIHMTDQGSQIVAEHIAATLRSARILEPRERRPLVR